jgi:HPt (histidine-containing phosphotransfer) domain-containing protein
MRGDKERCLAAGCSGYLSKPINIDELLQTVADALNTGAEDDPNCFDDANPPSASAKDFSESYPIRSTLPTDRPQFRKIVDSFVGQLPTRIDEMRSAQAASDTDKLAELAHWLKGAGGTIGFGCFTEPASRLEQAAKQKRMVQIDGCLRELISLADRIAAPIV